MMQNGSASHPTYVTLIAKDETVFMARRDALIKASYFFENGLKVAWTRVAKESFDFTRYPQLLWKSS